MLLVVYCIIIILFHRRKQNSEKLSAVLRSLFYLRDNSTSRSTLERDLDLVNTLRTFLSNRAVSDSLKLLLQGFCYLQRHLLSPINIITVRV